MVKNVALHSDADLRKQKAEIRKIDMQVQSFANRFGEYDKNGESPPTVPLSRRACASSLLPRLIIDAWLHNLPTQRRR